MEGNLRGTRVAFHTKYLRDSKQIHFPPTAPSGIHMCSLWSNPTDHVTRTICATPLIQYALPLRLRQYPACRRAPERLVSLPLKACQPQHS